MKKFEVEKIVSKSIIITAILLGLMLLLTFVETQYNDPLANSGMRVAVVVISITFAVIASVLVVLGAMKNEKYYLYATIMAVAAIFFMLIKVHYDVFTIGFKIGVHSVGFYYIAIAIWGIAVIATWINAVLKIARK